jgi:hypothetical protein
LLKFQKEDELKTIFAGNPGFGADEEGLRKLFGVNRGW